MRIVLVSVALLLSSCGALVAPSGSAPRSAASEEATSALQLSVSEGRPRGVALKLGAVEGAPGCELLALYRLAEGEEQATRLQEISLDETVRDALVGGVEIVDRGVTPGRRFTYQVVGVDARGDVIHRSTDVEVVWEEPPPRPQEVTAHAPFVDVVELDWTAPPDTGAVIFRRDVLDTQATFVRVAELQTGSDWVDRDVTAAGVWSYRVALASRHDGIVQYGPPSSEVYASTPEAPE